MVVAGLIVAVLALAGGVVAFWSSREPAAVAAPQVAPTLPPTPVEQAARLLDAQAAALLKGDEKGWLAPVDPARPELVARYRNVYRNLRGLDVSHAEFHAQVMSYGMVPEKPDLVTVKASLGYCFSGVACPTWHDDVGEGPPKARHQLTFEPVKGKYLITGRAELTGRSSFNRLQPAPWDGDALVFARGPRVTIAAHRSQAKHLKKVLAAAEQAAVNADRFAGYVGNRQQRYRIYLADDRAWRTWYGGERSRWAIGYARTLNSAGSDVVLRTGKVMTTRQRAARTIQHELGHVVTLAGLTRRDTGDSQWLVEGIAEYIGDYPRAATDTGNRDVVAAEFRRRDAPRTIATAPLVKDADDRTVDKLYAMGHFATSCMADQYGERKLFAFVDRVLRHAAKPDQAARAVYGKSFAAVDKSCLKWIKRKVS
ncbi:hypothetical protein DMB66_16195 [Actinoplanes sp. ATCC 53533]|nr:hypothetical protein DMB66_16195 [Actinoplanes sp. ATCC 53533]